MALYEKDLEGLLGWFKITSPPNHDKAFSGAQPEENEWYDKRIGPVWDYFVNLATRGGITELISAKQVLLNWLQESQAAVNPTINASLLFQEEVEKKYLIIPAEKGDLSITIQEIDFRLSVLKNVLWRHLMHADSRLWEDLSQDEQKNAIISFEPTPLYKKYLRAIRKAIDEKGIYSFKSCKELYIAVHEIVYQESVDFPDQESMYSQVWGNIDRWFENMGTNQPKSPLEWKEFLTQSTDQI